MNGRFEIRETTNLLDAASDLHRVAIADLVNGLLAEAVAKTYTEAEWEAWYKLKALQQEPPVARVA